MPRTKPKSDVGTAMARLNTGLYGLASDAPVIPGVESEEEWIAFRDALVADRAPVGALEVELVGRAATLLWRLRRPARFEREYIAASVERVPDDFLRRSLNRSLPRSLKEADQNVETVTRCLRLLEGLTTLPVSTPISVDDVEFIFEAVTRDDPDAEELLKTPLPGFGEGIANAGEWTVPLLRTAFRVLAEKWEVAPEALLSDTIEHAREVAEERAEERAAMLAEQDRMRRERLLPDAPTLHVLTRYESSLHRMCVQTLRELEAVQARRRGQSAPLLRADIHLVAEK